LVTFSVPFDFSPLLDADLPFSLRLFLQYALNKKFQEIPSHPPIEAW
jgi:hypothetical protein